MSAFNRTSITRQLTFTAVLSLLLLVLASGCRHYSLGNTAELPYQRLYVAPVVNRSLAPQAQSLVSGQLIEQLMRDPRLTIVSNPEQADAVLEVTLIDYTRNVGATSTDDTYLGRMFELHLVASCSLTNPRDGSVYFSDRIVSAEASSLSDGGFQSNEYQAMPSLARDLAARIVRQATAVW